METVGPPPPTKGISVKYRLVTRSDFDGLVCAVLLRRLELIDEIVVDLRDEEIIYAGNRFLVYALFPQARVSVHVLWGKQKLNTVLAVGRSILDRTSPTDIGAVMLRYGGGGHVAAGTCQVPHDEAERVIGEVVAAVGAPRTVAV
jgi:nanoRNase/pAp phosphatase (c-di-AMP/oligoRNAs hydrolase)